MVALAFGQSNSANYGESRLVAMPGVYSFYGGRLYSARDPMLGASGDGGSVWTRLGNRIIERKLYDCVVFITIGEGASDIRRWSSNGDLHARLVHSIRTARTRRLTITHILWHQGESDAAFGTAGADYNKMFMDIVRSIRNEGCYAPIYVSQASRSSARKPNAEIRSAQHELVNPAAGIFQGPDTDMLGYAYRYDGTHFTDEGLEQFASLWMKCLFGTSKTF